MARSEKEKVVEGMMMGYVGWGRFLGCASFETKYWRDLNNTSFRSTLVGLSYPASEPRTPQMELPCEELSFSPRLDVVKAELLSTVPVRLAWPYPLPIPSEELIALWIEAAYLGNYCQQLVPREL